MATQPTAAQSTPTYAPIACKRHMIIMLLIQAALVIFGFWAQRPSGEGSVLPEHRNVVPLYLSIIALEWGLVASVRGAVHDRGLRLRDVIGGRWANWKDVARDIALCIPFLLIWNGSAWLMHRLLGQDTAKSINTL